MHEVLLIDDDAKLGAVLTEYCARFSIQVHVATTPSSGLAQYRARGAEAPFDAIILDVMLPEMDGFDVLRLLRAEGNTPVIMLSARGDVTDRIVGLEIGADDYLPKPFDPRELVARLLSNIKRNAGTAHPSELPGTAPRRFDGITLIPDQRRVVVGDNDVNLTTKEYALLMLLSAEPGRTWSRDELLASLKGTDNELFSRSIDILVSRLRAKLSPAAPIVTVHGEGYTFVGRRAS